LEVIGSRFFHSDSFSQKPSDSSLDQAATLHTAEAGSKFWVGPEVIKGILVEEVTL
jgi:hypothetical protein